MLIETESDAARDRLHRIQIEDRRIGYSLGLGERRQGPRVH